MIFGPELIDRVLDGSKTVTRRRIKWVPNLQPDGWDGQRDGMNAMPVPYRVGNTYAVQPGRGKKSVGRIRILSITVSAPAAVDAAEARREGFRSTLAFREYWARLYRSQFCRPVDWDEQVWRIEFEVVA